jgi:hypothetical protein
MISDGALKRVLPASAVALLGDLLRWLAWAIVVAIWVAFLPAYAGMIRLAFDQPSNSDFTIFYYTSRLVRDGLSMYGESPAQYGLVWGFDHLGNLNPPQLQLFMMPLAWLSYEHALIAWVALSGCCLAASLVVIARALGLGWSMRRALVTGAVVLPLSAFTSVASTCELTFVLMLPFTLAWRAWREGRWRSAGAWLGLCASAKIFLLLFLPWLILRRHWTAVRSFVAVLFATVLIAATAFGVGAYRLWLATLSDVFWWWMPMNVSWQGFFGRTLEGGPGLMAMLPPVAFVHPVTVAGTAFFVALVALLALRSRWHSADRQMMSLFLAALLMSPLGWVYYLPMAFGPFVGWLRADHDWQGIRSAGRDALILGLTGFALLYVPSDALLAGQPSGIATATIASTYFWGVLFLWLSTLWARQA